MNFESLGIIDKSDAVKYLLLSIIAFILYTGAAAQVTTPITLSALAGYPTIAQAYGLPVDYRVSESEICFTRGPAKEVSRHVSEGDQLQRPPTQRMLTTLHAGDLVSFLNVKVTKGSRLIKLAPKNFVIVDK